jgi:hypothetical protein
MSIFARLFGESNPTPQMAAADLGLHLLQMAMAVEGALGIRETDPNKSGVAMQEILWAYLNLADRSFFGLFGPVIRDKAMQHIDAMLPESITEALCSSWPEELKQKHVDECAENMRSAETEYGHLKVTGSPKEDDLFMRCALNVVQHMGHPGDWNRALPLCMVRMKTYTEMPMAECVRNLGNAIRG